MAIEKPRKNYWEIGILRLKIGTSEETLKFHLQGKNIEVKQVFRCVHASL